MQMTDEIMQNIERRALDARVSITDLCGRSGVSPATFTRWRAGRKPWVRTIVKLETALDAIEKERG